MQLQFIFKKFKAHNLSNKQELAFFLLLIVLVSPLTLARHLHILYKYERITGTILQLRDTLYNGMTTSRYVCFFVYSYMCEITYKTAVFIIQIIYTSTSYQRYYYIPHTFSMLQIQVIIYSLERALLELLVQMSKRVQCNQSTLFSSLFFFFFFVALLIFFLLFIIGWTRKKMRLSINGYFMELA